MGSAGKLDTDMSGGWMDALLGQEIPRTEWLIEPLLPKGGVVFLHGPTSVGKSPFTWALSSAVSEGTAFSGYPVTESGPVLYIELDTPMNLILPRLARLAVKPKFMWLEGFGKPINILDKESKEVKRLKELQDTVQPVFVIFNTLRKAFLGDDKSSDMPLQVYGTAMELFPSACILFAHHDKKTPMSKDAKVDQDQMFSGSGHWANDAQIALHIRRKKEPKQEGEAHRSIMVEMTKSQVCNHEDFPPLQMRLDTDGTNWIHTGPAAYRAFYQSLPPQVPHGARIERVMGEFNIGKSAAYNACRELKEG